MPATHGVLRLVRSAVLSTACLLLGMTAHVVAGGRLPTVPMTVVLGTVLTCGCVWLTGSQVGPARLALLLGGSQLALHEAFMALAAPSCSGPASMAGHSPVPAGCGPATMPMHTAMSAPTAMVAAHVAAATGLGLTLWYGERLLWAFLGWAGVVTVRALPQVTTFRAAVATGSVRRPAGSVGALGGVGRRGPPRPGALLPA